MSLRMRTTVVMAALAVTVTAGALLGCSSSPPTGAGGTSGGAGSSVSGATTAAPAKAKGAYQDLTPDQVAQRLNAIRAAGGDSKKLLILDVNPMSLYKKNHIAGSVNLPLEYLMEPLPLEELRKRYSFLDPDVETITVCESGIRSKQAAQILADLGFKQVYNMKGGLSRWQGPLEK